MISIALTSYNGEKYIREQLDSISNQTIQDFEIIVCDDVSKDNTWNILQEYKEKDSRFRIYRNEQNLGFKKNFEKAISLCKGDYIALSDQDDIWTNDHLEILFNLIGDNYLACGNALLVDGNGKSLDINISQMVGFVRQPSNSLDLSYRILLRGNVFQGSSMLLSREFLKIALPIPVEIKFHDGWFAAIASIADKIVYTDIIVNNHRRHFDNNSSLKSQGIITKIRNFVPQSKVVPNEKYYILSVNERLDKKLLTENQKDFIKKVVWYFENLQVRKYRLRLAVFRFSNYSKIYSTSSKKYFLTRLIKFIIT